jgi:hypothetical protein
VPGFFYFLRYIFFFSPSHPWFERLQSQICSTVKLCTRCHWSTFHFFQCFFSFFHLI